MAANRLQHTGSYPINSNWTGVWSSGFDAALNWGNGKVFFFRGSQYMRYDLVKNKVDPGYPKSIAFNWGGLHSSGVDAAFLDHTQLNRRGNVTTGEEHKFSFNVGSEPRRLDIVLSGDGDADIYVNGITPATTADWDCRPYLSTSNEVCTIRAATGRYYVTIRGYKPSSNYDLDATFSW